MKRIVIIVAMCAISALSGAGLLQAQQKMNTKLTSDDYFEIQRLLYTNHTGYDFAIRDNGDMWTHTFLADAVLDNGNTHLVGEKEIRAYATDPLKTFPNRKFRHWTSTFNVTPNPEGATLSAFYLVISDSQDNPGMVIGPTGRYESLVVKTKNGWRIKHHVIFGEGSATARPAPASARGAAPPRQ